MLMCNSRHILKIVIHSQVNFDESGVIMTEPYLNFRSVQEAVDEIFFEEYQVPFFLRCNRKFWFYYLNVLLMKYCFVCCFWNEF